MRFHPSPATKTWEDDGLFYGEWSDRAVDDEDRYAPDGVILIASVPVGISQDKRLDKALLMEFDRWVSETRK